MTTLNIQATDFSMETNIISLNFVPTFNEQNELFGNDDSIILEF
jgi:hypothetical protein